jgi:hypothetical protein
MDSVTDLDLNEDFDIHLDSGGDLALTSGIAQIEQSVAIDVRDELQNFIGSNVTADDAAMLREKVRQAINDDPQLVDAQRVSFDTFDQRTNTASFTIVAVTNNEFTIDLPINAI